MAKHGYTAHVLVPTLAFALMSTGPVFAQDSMSERPDYLDDRSTPEALIRSYYNAVNRQEYARAYSYYEEGAAPRGYDAFATGYKETASVRVKIGDIEGEGTAGSTYWTIPLAIEATASDGTIEVFGGCYTVRLVDPTIDMEPPFEPMSIVAATLKPSDQPLKESVPQNVPPGCK